MCGTKFCFLRAIGNFKKIIIYDLIPLRFETPVCEMIIIISYQAAQRCQWPAKSSSILDHNSKVKEKEKF